MCENFYVEKANFFQEAKAVIEKYQKIVIFGHLDPDGDCIGCQISVYYSLKEKYPNKEIYFPFAEVNFSKFLLPKNYQNDIDAKTLKNALIIILDLNSKKRIPMEIPKENFVIQIDHHNILEKNLANLSWVNTEAAACCQMIYFFLKRLNLPITKNVASALLLGLITDSGNFTYSNVSDMTFFVASKLLENGAKLEIVRQNLFPKKDIVELKIDAYFLSNFVQKEKFVYFSFRPEDKKKITWTKEVENPFVRKVGLFSSIKNINIWASFTQMDANGFIKGSIRSAPGVDIEGVVKKYGGGGHAAAAGIATKDWSVIEKLIMDLAKLSQQSKS